MTKLINRLVVFWLLKQSNSKGFKLHYSGSDSYCILFTENWMFAKELKMKKGGRIND